MTNGTKSLTHAEAAFVWGGGGGISPSLGVHRQTVEAGNGGGGREAKVS